MANESDLKYDNTQLCFADHSTDFNNTPATAANDLTIGTPTEIQLDLTNVAASGGARQSAKSGDLGDPRVSMYRVDACIEFETAPTDGGTVDFYWCNSPSSTAGTGNAAGLSGSDASFTGTTGNLAQMTYIGSLTVRNNVINIGYVGRLQPEHRYGILVVVNNADQAMRSTATAMDETHITFTGLAYVPGA
jgi:hypothetical protein